MTLFSAMRFDERGLHLIDQRYLPIHSNWHCYQNLEDVAKAIEDMVVRGAPAIGCAAAFAIALEARRHTHLNWYAYKHDFYIGLNRLAATRPTAVNLFHAIEVMKSVAQDFLESDPVSKIVGKLEQAATSLFANDLAICRKIGEYGLKLSNSSNRLRVLTHCNTGSLATAGYGTALGVIRSIHEANKLQMVYVDETRPWLQGSRLTAYELAQDKIPFKLIADSAAAMLMANHQIDCIVVGADRIAANGDTANKIGTYSLAVIANYHQIPFYIAAPAWSFDPSILSGSEIKIEERSPAELTDIRGERIAPADTQVFNPSFDVTPANLISGIITEFGILEKPFAETISLMIATHKKALLF